jgi:hypothetical protein
MYLGDRSFLISPRVSPINFSVSAVDSRLSDKSKSSVSTLGIALSDALFRYDNKTC